MKVKKAHLFFEQSGVFRDAFRKHGIEAECYDIDNQDGQTDNVVDLFEENHKAFNDEPSIIDNIYREDITMAFFPCIHFEQFATTFYNHTFIAGKNWTEKQRTIYGCNKFDKCAVFYRYLWEMIAVFKDRGLRLVLENPVNGGTLLNYLLPKPQYIDKDRTLMGDCFKKPTAYWFFNCEPENYNIIVKNKNTKKIKNTKSNSTVGICSLERSRIEPIYAFNFISSKILGSDCVKKVNNIQFKLF